MMYSAWVGWALAVLAVAVGYASYGWQGVVLAVTVVVFWLLLQFSQALRVMRRAAAQPVGTVRNAVMLHVRLKPGLRLMQLLPLAGSLGRRVDDGGPNATHEIFEWTDAGGDRVRVELQGGRVSRFELLRNSASEGEGEQAALVAQADDDQDDRDQDSAQQPRPAP